MKINVFSGLAAINCVAVLAMGHYVYFANEKSLLNRLFALLCLSLAAWASAEFLYIGAVNANQAYFWIKGVALVWPVPSALVIHFALVFTGRRKWFRRKYVYLLIYAPAILFSAVGYSTDLIIGRSVRRPFGYQFIRPTESWFYWVSGILVVSMAVFAIILCLRFYQKTVDRREKQQAKYVSIGLSIPVVFGVITLVAPALGLRVPDLTVAAMSGLAVFVGYAISRHGLFVVDPATAAQNIIATMTDSLVLIAPEGEILTANKATEKMLGYSSKVLLSLSVRDVFADAVLVDRLLSKLLASEGFVENYETAYLTRTGKKVPVLFSGRNVQDGQGNQIGAVLIAKDISERKQAEETIRHMAYYDNLTDLPNRTLFDDRLHQALSVAKRERRLLALFYIDLDKFKNLNDEMGHDVGDVVLNVTGSRLASCLRKIDTPARIGGDEFNALLTDVGDRRDVAKVAKKILQEVARPLNLNSHQTRTSASIGISLYPQDAQTAEGLIAGADMALRRAKEKRARKYQFFTKKIKAQVFEATELAKDLSGAMKAGQLVLYYQPCVDLATGRVVGAEAVLRWQHPQRGLVPPEKLIEVAEETNLVAPIGEWVLASACRQAKSWCLAGHRGLRIMVKLSARQLELGRTAPLVKRKLEEACLSADALVLEVPETTLAREAGVFGRDLRALADRGVAIAADDFGLGCSSWQVLRNLPVGVIKIAGELVRNIPIKKDMPAIFKNIVTVAHALGLEVIAQGVKTNQQLDYVRRVEVDAAQGCLLSRPVEAPAFERLLRKRRNGLL